MDKVTTKKELVLNANFADGDTRTITLEDPKTTVEATAINAVGTTLATTQVFIGDKAGAAFLDFGTKAKIREQTRTVLDLNS